MVEIVVDPPLQEVKEHLLHLFIIEFPGPTETEQVLIIEILASGNYYGSKLGETLELFVIAVSRISF